MTSHSLDPKKNPKNEKLFVAALFATVCRLSSVFFLRAQCLLKLIIRNFLIAQKKKKIKKKELHRESWMHMDNQRSQWSCPYMCRISNSAFVSKFNSQPRPRNSKNRKQSQKRVTIDNHSSQTHIRSFKFDFLK